MAAMKSDPGTFARGFPRHAALEENGNVRNNKRRPGGNISRKKYFNTAFCQQSEQLFSL